MNADKMTVREFFYGVNDAMVATQDPVLTITLESGENIATYEIKLIELNGKEAPRRTE